MRNPDTKSLYDVHGQPFSTYPEAESYAKTASLMFGSAVFVITCDGLPVQKIYQGKFFREPSIPKALNMTRHDPFSIVPIAATIPSAPEPPEPTAKGRKRAKRAEPSPVGRPQGLADKMSDAMLQLLTNQLPAEQRPVDPRQAFTAFCANRPELSDCRKAWQAFTASLTTTATKIPVAFTRPKPAVVVPVHSALPTPAALSDRLANLRRRLHQFSH